MIALFVETKRVQDSLDFLSNGDDLVLLFVSRDRRGDGIIQTSEEKKDEEEHSPTGNREKRFLLKVNF